MERVPYEREGSDLKGFARIYPEYLCYPVTKEFRARLYDEIEKFYENACKELRLNHTNYEESHIV